MSDDKKPGGSEILQLVDADKTEPEHKALMARIDREFPKTIELHDRIARDIKNKYDSLKKHGFDDRQALTITLKWMWP